MLWISDGSKAVALLENSTGYRLSVRWAAVPPVAFPAHVPPRWQAPDSFSDRGLFVALRLALRLIARLGFSCRHEEAGQHDKNKKEKGNG